jgi:small subunit ribosomal protein S17
MTKFVRSKKGTVVGDKMDKTIVVRVDTYKTHPKYHKRYRNSKKFYAHDPENKYKEGDDVTIYEAAPLSRLKRWSVIAPEAASTETTTQTV